MFRFDASKLSSMAMSVRRSVRPPLWARMKYLTILDGLTLDTNVHGSQMIKIIFIIFDFLIYPPSATRKMTFVILNEITF